MTPAEALLVLLRDARALLDTAMNGLPSALLAKQPPGNSNPIGVIYAHAIGVEDLYVQQIFQAKPLVWLSGDWPLRLGRDLSPNLWDRDAAAIDLAAFMPYRDAVYATTEAYMSALSPTDLDRELTFPGRDWSMSLARLLAVVVSHCSSHAGEIAALRGVMGDKGLPY